MGFLAPAAGIVADAIATAMVPPPEPNITRWCEENVIFDDRSPVPGAFNIERFPFLREIHEVLSPEHPAREVTVRGSAQWGKTVSIIQPTLGAWHEYTALDSLVVHPTQSAASEWVTTKWLPMRRSALSLRRIFGAGRGQNRDNMYNQETLALDGSLKVASSGSPADLTGTSRRLVIMDDLSKFEASEKGDPESLAESRASGFEDAKIARVSTAMLTGTCRITLAYARSDQRLYFLPCPNCANMAPLTWENFLASIDPEDLAGAGFGCSACDLRIGHRHKAAMLRGGQWRAQNPKGDHPGFHLWRAYSPLRDWASIAREYARLRGWTRVTSNVSTGEAVKDEVKAETEQVFWNDVLGLPFEQASDAPDWEALRDRTEDEELARELGLAVLARRIVPASGVLLAAGVDCQDDRTEVHLRAFGRYRQSWSVDYITIPHHIGDSEGRAALNALLKQNWRTELGQDLAIDCLAIDGGTYTDDVWSWAKTHPWSRVIIVKGASTHNGPLMVPMKFERRKDGKQKRRQKRAFMLNVSMMKGQLFTWMHQSNPTERGFMHFARGLGDEFFRQLTAEKKIVTRSATGVMVPRWVAVEAARRNEALDTALYAEAGARRKGWASMTDLQWEALAEARGRTVTRPADRQGDLFDAGADTPDDVSVAPPDEVAGLAASVARGGGGAVDPVAAARVAKLAKLNGILGNG